MVSKSNSGGHNISAEGFLREYDIKHPTSKRFIAHKYKEFLVIDLDGPSEDAGRVKKLKTDEKRALDRLAGSS